MRMNAEVICSDCICDYCRNKYDYKQTGIACNCWYHGDVCRDAEDFEGKDLIEVSE